MTKKSRGGKPKPKPKPDGRVGNNAGTTMNSAWMSSAHELGQEPVSDLVKDHLCAGYSDEESIRDWSPEEKEKKISPMAEKLHEHALTRPTLSANLSALISSASELGEEQFRELVKEHPCAWCLDKEKIRNMSPEMIAQALVIGEMLRDYALARPNLPEAHRRHLLAETLPPQDWRSGSSVGTAGGVELVDAGEKLPSHESGGCPEMLLRSIHDTSRNVTKLRNGRTGDAIFDTNHDKGKKASFAGNVGLERLETSKTSASCWICLEGENNDTGEPLVRDCSCRGDTVGYAHLSCLVQYAKGESKEDRTDRAWHMCPHCNQQYQNQVRIDLSSAFLAFEEAGGRDIMDALRVKIESISDVLIERTRSASIPLSRSGGDDDALSAANTVLRDDAVKLIKRYLSLALQERKDKKALIARFAHMPPWSPEYQLYKECVKWEAYAYERLGLMYNLDHSKENWEMAVKYWKKAQCIFKLIGSHVELNSVTTNLSLATAKLDKLDDIGAEQSPSCLLAKSRKEGYEHNIQQFGKNDDRTIFAGIYYAESLLHENRYIEAQRLAAKMSLLSHQVLGLDHNYTKIAGEIMSKCKERFAFVWYDVTKPSIKEFQLLRYDANEDVYVMMGPVENPRNVNEEREFRFPWDQVLPKLGWPVVCHGLQSSSHLNGKLGEVRHFYNAKTKRCIETKLILKTFFIEKQWFRVTVQFVDKSLQPVAVKLENLRIVFDLPGTRRSLLGAAKVNRFK